MQIKTAIRYYCTLMIRVLKNIDDTKGGNNAEHLEMGIQNHIDTLKNSLAVS